MQSRCRIATLVCFLVAIPLSADEKPASPSPDRWLPTIAKFMAEDEQQGIQPGGVVFVGSSSIRLWNLKKSFPDYQVLNRGFGGSEIEDSVRYIGQLVLKHQPKTVVLYAGDNDIAKGKSAETVAKDFQRFVAAVKKNLPKTRILFIAIKPSIKRWQLSSTMKKANESIEALCAKSTQLEFIDIWEPMLGKDGRPHKKWFVKDGLHLNEEGYQLWTGLVLNALKSS